MKAELGCLYIYVARAHASSVHRVKLSQEWHEVGAEMWPQAKGVFVDPECSASVDEWRKIISSLSSH